MGIKEIAKKLLKPGERKEAQKGKTPNEVELEWFREKERLDRVKTDLARYRLKENKEVLLSDCALLSPKFAFKDDTKKKSLLNVRMKKTPSILNSPNVFGR